MILSPVLALENLSISLPAGADRTYAVHDVSLSVNSGEIVCLVGESGSGKSMIAYATMGLLPRGLKAVEGDIRLEGESLLTANSARLRSLRCARMSMIFQEPATALNPVIRCGDQIDEVLELHTNMTPTVRRARIREILARVGLLDAERICSAYPFELSGGQRQRIMIAMALILEPALLVADEPTTALDVTTQAQILDLIKSVQRERGMGVLFITHDFGVVSEIADRVVVMRSGQLVEEGSVRAVLARPSHDYTRALMSAVPSLTPRPRTEHAASEILLQVKDLEKEYRSRSLFNRRTPVHAVSDVSLTMRRGESLAIVGESGSGKSTVARCIARLIEPTSGEIWLDGENFALFDQKALRAHRRKVQVVFQDPYRSLNPRRTVGASIIEGPMNFGMSKSEARGRAEALLALVGMDKAAVDRFPHQFSGGQRQRICIARALAMEPELLIADEAVSALDVSVQAQVLQLLEDIRKRMSLSILFITHDLRVAAQICTGVAVMHRGRVVEAGDLAKIFAAPQHEYTRALLAAAPGRHWTFGAAAPAAG